MKLNAKQFMRKSYVAWSQNMMRTDYIKKTRALTKQPTLDSNYTVLIEALHEIVSTTVTTMPWCCTVATIGHYHQSVV